VDLGSSTLDITHVNASTAKPVDRGIPLGAGLIDKAISDHLRNKVYGEQLERWLEPGRARPGEALRLLFRCRMAKEAYFRNDRPTGGNPMADRVFVPQGAPDDVYFLIRLDRRLMDSVLAQPQPTLQGRGWREAYRAELARAAEEAGRLDLVILTGGASRMRFAHEDAQEIFDAPVVLGHEPELAIAKGLAIAGRISVRAAGFRADVQALLAGDAVERLVRNSLPVLSSAMGTAVAEGSFERHVVPAFRAWRSGQIRQLTGVEEAIAAALRVELGDPDNTTVQRVSTEWLQRLRPNLADLTDAICSQWRIPVSALRLPAVSVHDHEWRLPSSVTGVISSHAERVAKIIVNVIYGVLAFMVAAAGLAVGGGGVLFTGAAVGLSYFFARNWTETQLREADIPDRIRSEFSLDGLRKKSAEMEAGLRDTVSTAISGPASSDIVAQVSAMLRSEMQECAREAELLIE
jgi:hypothetical protein